MDQRYCALLASRLQGLEDLRARVWRQGQRSGTPVWVSEIDARDAFAGKDLDFIQLACLKQVRAVPKFICVLDGSFGTTWNEGQVSILELELATAAFSRRDVLILLLAPFDRPDPRIASLLKAIVAACPAVRIKGPLTPDQVLANIAWMLEPTGRIPETLRTGVMVQDLARTRSPVLNFQLHARDVHFLNGAFAALLGARPDKQLVGRLIDEAEADPVMPNKLARLWIAVRHLSSAPYTDGRFEEYLTLWERALGRWSSASAWYGLHGHFFLGRLAAVNSLSIIRQHMPAAMRREAGPPSIFANAGAAASEYYSIAKLVPSPWQRRTLLRKALWNVNAALSEPGVSDPTGLLDIRGHIRLALFNPLGALSDLKRALAIRRDQGQSEARIGECEVHLGRAYAACRRLQKAEKLLEDGVARLTAAGDGPFAAQALRHLAVLYRQTGRTKDAVATLRRAQRMAREREIEGQLEQIENELRQLGEQI